MHTPGPWLIDDGLIIAMRNEVPVPIAEPRDIAAKSGHSQIAVWNEEAANVRLIAAAPDLLEALIACLDSQECNGYIGVACIDEARAAIAKATGEQP